MSKSFYNVVVNSDTFKELITLLELTEEKWEKLDFLSDLDFDNFKGGVEAFKLADRTSFEAKYSTWIEQVHFGEGEYWAIYKALGRIADNREHKALYFFNLDELGYIRSLFMHEFSAYNDGKGSDLKIIGVEERD